MHMFRLPCHFLCCEIHPVLFLVPSVPHSLPWEPPPRCCLLPHPRGPRSHRSGGCFRFFSGSSCRPRRSSLWWAFRDKDEPLCCPKEVLLAWPILSMQKEWEKSPSVSLPLLSKSIAWPGPSPIWGYSSVVVKPTQLWIPS